MTIRRPAASILPVLLIGATALATQASVAGPIPARAEESFSPCPASAQAVVDGFYRWFLAAGDRSRKTFASQKSRFTPELFADLQQAFALEPSRDGRFLDFDPFSGTQMSSLSYRIEGCRPTTDGHLAARVGVQIGRSGTHGPFRPIELSLQRDGAGWRIADFRYLDETPFRLQPLLRKLIDGP